MSSYGHIFAISTTGVLGEATRALSTAAGALTAMAKNKAALEHLAESLDNPTLVYRPLVADPHRTGDVIAHFKQAMHYAPIDLVLANIPPSAHDSSYAVTKLLAEISPDTRIFHVLSSAAYEDPFDKLELPLTHFREVNPNYHQIILGFVKEEKSRRELSSTEIARGVEQAVAQPQPCSLIGTVTT